LSWSADHDAFAMNVLHTQERERERDIRRWLLDKQDKAVCT